MDAVFKTKQSEKDTFTDRLQALSTEERNVDTVLKINKLGVWGKGLQKNLTTYMKDADDDEREFMEKMAGIEKEIRTKKNNIGNIDDNIEQELEERNIDDEIEREEYDMSHMDEDYMNGDPYGYEQDDQEEYD